MPLLNTADKVYVGAAQANAVYLGANKVWPPASTAPIPTTGLTVWLDASQIALADGAPITTLVNLGVGPTPTIVDGSSGTEPLRLKTGVLNGQSVMRFTVSGSRIRGTWTSNVDNWTVLYLVRLWGTTFGRAFTVQYPPSNLLVGMHTSTMDAMYDNGAWLPNDSTGWPGPGPLPWKMYEADSDSVSGIQRFFIDGVASGSYSGVGGFTNGWGLSGYDPANTAETMDIDVAELVIYTRKLADAERVQVENYLRDKWFPLLDPATSAYMAATGLDASYAPALDALVVGLKSHGLWTKMSAVYPFIGGTAALHKWNLINPVDSDAAYRLTFTSDAHSGPLGYIPNPVGTVVNGGYANTHCVPLGLLNQDSTHLAYYSLQDLPAISRCEMGCFAWSVAQSRFHIIARYTPSEFYYGMSENGGSNVTVPAASGLFVTTRTTSTLTTAYRNGVSVGTSPTVSIGLPTVPVWVGGIDTFPDRSDLPCGFASIGSGLTTQNVADLYTVVQAYQTALGRQI